MRFLRSVRIMLVLHKRSCSADVHFSSFHDAFFRIHLVLRSVSRRFSLSFILEYANAASIAPMITDAIAITSPIPDEFADAIPIPMIADPVPNNMSPRFI